MSMLYEENDKKIIQSYVKRGRSIRKKDDKIREIIPWKGLTSEFTRRIKILRGKAGKVKEAASKKELNLYDCAWHVLHRRLKSAEWKSTKGASEKGEREESKDRERTKGDVRVVQGEQPMPTSPQLCQCAGAVVAASSFSLCPHFNVIVRGAIIARDLNNCQWFWDKICLTHEEEF